MKRTLSVLLLLALWVGNSHAKDYVNYTAIHTGVDQQIKEDARQKEMRDRMATATALEISNRENMTLLQKTYHLIQNRFNSLGLVFDGFSLAVDALPIINSILAAQQEIISEVAADPALVPIALESEREFVDRGKSLVAFMTGLMLTVGDLNQMRPSDRKLLLDNAVTELQRADSQATGLLGHIRSLKMARLLQLESFRSYVNQDKQLIRDIIRNAKMI